MQKWKKINGWPDYQISTHGKVKSFKWGKERILRQQLRGTKERPYYYVILCEDGNCFSACIHKLVAEYFVPNPDNLSIIYHLDENQLNNHYKNLIWSTVRANTAHAFMQKETTSEYTGVCRSNGKWRAQILIDGKPNYLGHFFIELDAARAYQNALKNISI